MLLFLFSIICFSQSIDLVRFDNTQTYTPGSGVSMHINPTGIFVLDDPSNLSANTNNSFILELSAAGGSFATTTNLGSVDDFYTPLMNGVIPSGTASGEYKLRVRSTNPVTTVESGTFTIDASASSSLPTATTTMGVNTNYFECLNDGSNTINPYFGSLKQAYDATVANMPSGYRFLQIAASNSSNTLNVNLIDIGAGTTTAITATSAGVYTIPDTLAVGTYNFEVEEVDSSGNSSFFSFTFLFHTSATTFGTPGVDIVCTNTEVEFNVDISILGIGRNYMGSYYTFNWGDGTAVETKTHAEILAAYTAPLDLISHTFAQPSCSASGESTSFEVQMNLYNKGLSVNGTNPACDEYIENGTGATKEIITSDAPEANFQLDDEQCITENIEAINTTINGSFPAPDGTCSGEPTFTWYYKTPTASDFVPVFSNSPWLVGNDLIIPAEDITIPGCWTIKLSAINPDFCQIEDLHEDTINIEAVPDADFDIIKNGQEVSQICVDDTVTLTDASNIVSTDCDNELPDELPTYQWTISPNSGYTLINDTTLTSQNPQVTFTSVGNYTITETVTTECGSDSFSSDLEVIGDPSVSFPDESQTYCSTSTLLINFANQLTPTYSTGLNAPTAYAWTVTGNGIDTDDYSFASSTTASDALPTIQLNSFGTYNITVTLDSNCGTDASDTVTITLSQTPTITNTTTSQTMCSAGASTEFTAVSDVAGTTFSWIATENENLSGYTSTGTTAAIPAQTITNNTNTDQDLAYTITPIADGCGGTPFEYTITVNPVPIIADKDETICSTETFTITPVDDSPTEIVPSGTKYDWGIPVSSPVGAITGGAAAANQTSISQTLTNTTNDPATLTYTVTPDANDCKGDSFDVVITVNPTVGVDAIANQTLCNGEDTLAIEFSTASASSLGTITYNWINNNTAIGLAASGTGDVPSFTVTNESEATISATITVTAVYTYNDDSCDGESETFTIKVNPSPQVDFSQENQVILTGETTTVVDLTSPTDDVTFAWTVSVPTGITGVTTLTGTDNIPAETLINSTAEPLDVVYSAVATGASAVSYFNFAAVAGGGVNWPSTSSASLYKSSYPNLTDAEFIDLALDYMWDSSEIVAFVIVYQDNNQDEIVRIVAKGSLATAYDKPTTTTGQQVYVFAENLTEASTNIGTTPIIYPNYGFECEGLPTEYTITVNPLAQVNPVDDQVVCNEDTLQIEFTTQNTGGITTYSWTNDNSNIGLSNAGTGNIDITATNTTDEPITATIVVTPSFENGGETNTGNSITFTITVNPTGQVDAVSNQIVSNGFDTTAITFSTTNVNGTTTYNWTNSITSIGLAATGTGNIPAFTGINTGSSPVTSTLNVTPTFENGSVDCIGPVEPFEITINPTAQVNPTDNMVVSDGETVTIPFTTINTGGTTTYTWTNTDPTTGLTTTGSSDIGFTAVNTGTSPITTTVVVTPDFENGGNSNTGPTETFTITVNPTAQIDPIDSMVLCNEDDTTAVVFTTENTGGVTTYSWTNDNTSIGLASSGTGTIGSFSVINTTTTAQVATIVVTPTFENGGNSNVGSTQSFTITVNPTGKIDAINDIISCDASTSGDIIFTTQNTDGNTTYSWTNNNTSIGLAADGTGNISSFNLTNTSTQTQTATITVTPTYTNNGISCSGTAETFTITIPMGQVNPIASQDLCSGDQSSEIIFTTVNTEGATTYSWTNDNTSIGLSSSGTGNIPVFSVINSTDTAQVANISVTPNYNYNGVVCTGPSEEFTITVNPELRLMQ